MRLLGFLLAAMMVISLFPVGVFAEDAAIDTGDSEAVGIEDADFTDATDDESGEGWTWNNDSKTLTLNGVTVKNHIVLPDGATIVVTEGTENSVTVESGNAIYADGALTISGKGKLSVASGFDVSGANAVCATGSVTVIDTELVAKAFYAVVAPSVSITNSKVDLYGYYYGIQAKTTTGDADSVVTLTNVSGKIAGYYYGGINAHSETADVAVLLDGCHDLKIYNEVNADSTSVNFTYAGIRAYTRGSGMDALVTIEDCENVSISDSTMAVVVANNANAANEAVAEVKFLLKDSIGITLEGRTSCYSAVFVNNYGIENDDSAILAIENSAVKVVAPKCIALMTSTKLAPSEVNIEGSTVEFEARVSGIRTISADAEYADTDIIDSTIVFVSEPSANYVDKSINGVVIPDYDFDFSEDLSKYEAVIGDVYYETLAEAITAANAMEGGATVTLLKDVTLSQKLTISGNVTIEGAYTLTRGDAYTGTLFVVNKGATLTLDGGLVIDGNNNYAFDADLYAQDLAAGLKIPSEDRTKWFTLEEGKPIASAFMFTTTGGTINFKKVTVQNNYSNASGVISAGANSNILLEGATITHIAANNNSGIVTNVSGANINVVINDGTVIDGIHVGGNHGVFKIYSGAKVTINGGEIKNTTGWNSNGVVAGMYGGTLIMNGGIICSNSSVVGPNNGRNAAIYGHSGHTFVMNGGIICHNTGYSGGGIDSPYSAEGNSGRTTITGGMVVDNVTIGNYDRPDVKGGDKLTITGGIYTQDVTEYVAPGYYVYHDEANGYYIVGKAIKLVTEGSDEVQYFATIAEAVEVARATEGKDTIYLLANHKEEKAIALFDGMTLDLQSFTLEAESLFATNGSYITGAVCKGADSGARLIVAKDAIALGQNAPSTGRGYVMPVWDATAGAFVFAELGIGIEEGDFDEGTLGVQFDISGSSYVKQNLLIDQASSGLHIEVVATWTENGETVEQVARLNDAAISASVLDKCSVKAYVALEGHENLTIYVRFVTDAGVVIATAPKTAQ